MAGIGSERGRSGKMSSVGQEEAPALLEALDEAEAIATRIIASMDRSHALMQDSIRDLRAANESLRASNAASAQRMRNEFNKASVADWNNIAAEWDVATLDAAVVEDEAVAA